MAQETHEDQFQRGLALQQDGRMAEAIEVYLDLARKVLTVKLALNLGLCLRETGDPVRAVHYLQLAARHKPQEPSIRRMLGGTYSETGQTELAESELLAALAIRPDDNQTKVALAGLYLSLGRYAEGWPLLQARIPLHPDVVPPIRLSFPEWRGEPIAGKSILVWIEQGFGDQIQFARFANSLKALGAAHVTLGCRPVLADLFSTLSGVDAVIATKVGETSPIQLHDYWSRYFSLPEALGVTLETLPAAPYLSVPAGRPARWADHAKGARVGLAWQASPTGFNGANKGLPPDQAQRLLAAGAISLDPADTGAQDFADTAAIIEGLDLVISIDTSVAHLAGAMGKPVWTLLPFLHCDWRWLRGRVDSPWYPSMRLYRHGERQDWAALVDRVLADLSAAKLGAA
ncbi:MAG: tetratricopeptide repeat-containing glycosyltransferase family protein [Phenylobacterium sp.]